LPNGERLLNQHGNPKGCQELSEIMVKILSVLQIITSLALIAVILLQAQGTGLGPLFGGAGEEYRSKRGLEKTLFYLTIILSVIFLGLSLLGVALR
jgi:preprotein translocase subunit SecG